MTGHDVPVSSDSVSPDTDQPGFDTSHAHPARVYDR